jgi:signal transduction histidine kinase
MRKTRMRVGTLNEQNCAMEETVRLRGAPRAHVGIGVWVAAAAASLVTVATVLRATGGDAVWSVHQQIPIGILVVAHAGAPLAAISAWVVVARHRRASVGLAVTTVAVTLPLWAGWPWLSDDLRVGLLAVAPLAVAGTAQVGLGWSTVVGSSRPLGWAYALASAATVVHFLAYNPFADPACIGMCTNVSPVIDGVIAMRSVVAVTAVLTTAAAVVAAHQLLRTTPATVPRVVGGSVIVAMALLVSEPIAHWVRWDDRLPSGLGLMIPLVAAAVVGGAVLAVSIRSHRSRAAIGRLISRLNDPEDVLGDLGAPIGGLHFALPDNAGWVDSLGLPVPDAPMDSRQVVISDGSGPVLRLPATRGREVGDTLEALTPGDRLSLKNAQLSAITRARVAEVQASRARVVAASDAERQRIERDLHDGAQQRLVSAALYLRVARDRLHNDIPPLRRAEASVREVLERLRRLAHGVFPGALETAGLWGALDDAVGDSLVPASLEVHGYDNVQIDTAMAAYSTVAAAIDMAGRTPLVRAVRVSARRGGQSLDVSVETLHDGPPPGPPDLTDVADRVGALGGELTISSTPNGILVEAVLPCAS